MEMAVLIRRCLFFGAVAALALGAVATSRAAAPVTVNGTVGPGFTIALKIAGKNVTKLKANAEYRFVISDRSDIHDFHLSGPGVNRVLTDVAFVGTKTFSLRLKKGSYRFFCDPHESFMHGSFWVA